jgi:hypothetical protein
MTSTPQNWAALRRAKFNRDRGLRRLSQVVDAQRRLNARRADSTRGKADPLGPELPPPRVPDAIARLSTPLPIPHFDEQRSDMPRVEVLTEDSGRDPEATLTERAPAQTLANEHVTDRLVDHTGSALVGAERQIKESYAHNGGAAVAAPARSVRRATARRASKRRATARSRQGDTEASIIDFLAHHPGSTAGDLAKGLNLNPGAVSPRLTQLAKSGEIKRASHGYSTNDAARPRTHRSPLGRSR